MPTRLSPMNALVTLHSKSPMEVAGATMPCLSTQIDQLRKLPSNWNRVSRFATRGCQGEKSKIQWSYSKINNIWGILTTCRGKGLNTWYTQSWQGWPRRTRMKSRFRIGMTRLASSSRKVTTAGSFSRDPLSISRALSMTLQTRVENKTSSVPWDFHKIQPFLPREGDLHIRADIQKSIRSREWCRFQSILEESPIKNL